MCACYSPWPGRRTLSGRYAKLPVFGRNLGNFLYPEVIAGTVTSIETLPTDLRVDLNGVAVLLPAKWAGRGVIRVGNSLIVAVGICQLVGTFERVKSRLMTSNLDAEIGGDLQQLLHEQAILRCDPLNPVQCLLMSLRTARQQFDGLRQTIQPLVNVHHLNDRVAHAFCQLDRGYSARCPQPISPL